MANLLRQLLERMQEFFQHGTPVHGSAQLTETEQTAAEIVSLALAGGDLDVRQPVEYRGYTIKPRKANTPWPPDERQGYWITKDGTNVAPGAAWFSSVREAKVGIDRLILAKDDATLFWLLNGSAGLSIQAKGNGAHHSVKSSSAPDMRVVRQDDLVTVYTGETIKGLHVETFTPVQALALAAMLRFAAEQALGASAWLYGDARKGTV